MTVDQFTTMLPCAGLAAFGSLARYMYEHVTRGLPLYLGGFFAAIVLGSFVGATFCEILTAEFKYRNATLLAAGFSVHQFLQVVEVRGGALVDKILGNKKAAEADKKEK